uniref:Uncharacterized protein n=1 Tax=Loxodonta africana TaxID=9785 RepID=G3U4Q7_LOXAF
VPSRSDLSGIKVMYLRCTSGQVSATSTLTPKISPLSLSPKETGDDIVKATSDCNGLKITVKLTIQNGQAQTEVVCSMSVLIIKALKEPPRNRKKQKNIKQCGNSNCQHCLTVAALMFSQKISGTMKGSLGTVNSVDCNVDGHPHDINSGAVECSAS